jgi:hypothetical protein
MFDPHTLTLARLLRLTRGCLFAVVSSAIHENTRAFQMCRTQSSVEMSHIGIIRYYLAIFILRVDGKGVQLLYRS